MKIKSKALYEKVAERGFCLCEVVKTKSSICPCRKFEGEGVCKCGVFER